MSNAITNQVSSQPYTLEGLIKLIICCHGIIIIFNDYYYYFNHWLVSAMMCMYMYIILHVHVYIYLPSIIISGTQLSPIQYQELSVLIVCYILV